jgi:predicted RNase H-like nuclease (RuvC/YqgF family)
MNLESFSPNQIADEQLREFVKELLNVIEAQRAEIAQLREENQQLRDEINRLKGEDGKPAIKASRGKSADFSSESERRERRRQRKGRKHDQIEINQEIVLPVEQENLPADAQFKGHAPHIVQDIEVCTNNTRFLREKYYSPSEGKTYWAQMPAGTDVAFCGQHDPITDSRLADTGGDQDFDGSNRALAERRSRSLSC